MNNRNNTLRRIMKAAWTIFRKGGVSFSQALTRAWAWAKKNLGPTKAAAFAYDCIERETEKAYLMRVEVYTCTGDNYYPAIWMPKSAFGGDIHSGIVAPWARQMAAQKVQDISCHYNLV
jgi:hypothetical protein